MCNLSKDPYSELNVLSFIHSFKVVLRTYHSSSGGLLWWELWYKANNCKWWKTPLIGCLFVVQSIIHWNSWTQLVQQEQHCRTFTVQAKMHSNNKINSTMLLRHSENNVPAYKHVNICSLYSLNSLQFTQNTSYWSKCWRHFFLYTPWRDTGEVEVQLHSFLTLTLNGGEQSALQPAHFTSMERVPSNQWTACCMSRRAGLHDLETEKSWPPPEFKMWIVQPIV